MKQVGLRLRRLRKAGGLPLRAVSSRTGITVSLLSRLERGIRTVRVPQLPRLAGALGRRCTVLFLPDDVPPFVDSDLELLEDVAAVLPHLTKTQRAVIQAKVTVWMGS